MLIEYPLQGHLHNTLRFYTYAPEVTKWPWSLRNIKQKPRPDTWHEIVDIAIYDLLKSESHKHDNDKLKAWKNLELKGWKVVPDCPDLNGEFGLNVDFDNVEYTKELQHDLYDPEDPHQLPVIQSNYGSLKSLISYCNWFKKEFGSPSKLAVGSVCKMDSKHISQKLLREVRRQFPSSWIHAFGLRMGHIKGVLGVIDSFDSTSWTFPRTGGRPTCKNKAMCLDYFWEYITRLEEIKYEDYSQRRLECFSPVEAIV